jgi:uncharacterized protein YggE
MRKVTLSLLVLAAMVAGQGPVTASNGRTQSRVQPDPRHNDQRSESVTPATEGNVSTWRSDRLIAQLFYPPASNSSALRVTGRGRVSEAADLARLVFKFNDTSLESPATGTLFYFKLAQATLTKERLKPIVDALVAAGVPSDAIEVKIVEARPSALPFPLPSTGTQGGAEIRVRIEQPTRDRLEQIVTTANQAAEKQKNLSIASVNVQYSAKDCQALERAAYQAAVRDAQNRAKAIAEAMGARMRRVGSVAEPFYNAYIPACNSNSGGNLPFGGDATTPFDPNAPVEVEITKEIFVSFPVE